MFGTEIGIMRAITKDGCYAFPTKNLKTATMILITKTTSSDIPISCNRLLTYTLHVYDTYTITYLYINEWLTRHKPTNDVIKIHNRGM